MSTPQQASKKFGIGAASALAAGGLVSLTMGVFGRIHQPVAQGITLGFGSVVEMKVWLAVVTGCFALIQLVTALWLYGKLGRPAPRRLGDVHRASGALAILVSLPVAYDCLWSLGFASYDTRVLAHSILGCLVYGAFVTKIITLHTRSAPGWLLPVAGGLLFTVLVSTVLTSAVWFLTVNGLPSSTGY